MTTASEKHSPSSSLQRGKACLRCRKRKMRCDGIKPACQQCIRAKKGDCCEYDDGKGKTRTQLLREKIEFLERRIKELEDPDNVLAIIPSHDPGQGARYPSESSSSGYGSPTNTDLHSPFPESAHSPDQSWLNLPGLIRTSSPLHDVLYEDPSLSTSQPSADLARMLIDLFTPHRYQCGLQTNLVEIRESLSRPPSEQRHPVLMNSIYLWACFVSRPEPLCQHEDYYLTRTLDALWNALRQGDRVLDIIEGSCLLASYYFANGRVREGSFHSGAAASLAIQYQLHHGVLFDQSDSPGRRASFPEASSRERIAAFWQVFNLDRCWSVIMHKPAAIPDGPDSWTSINCPWPQDESNYESSQFDFDVSFQTIRAFFNGDVSPSGFSYLALRAKASALFERAHHISLGWDSHMSTDIIGDEVHVMDMAIMTFVTGLLPLHQLDSSLPEIKHLVIAAYILAHTAMILLYRRFAKENASSYDKCLQASRAIVAICGVITTHDFPLIDPIIGHCWGTAADPLIHELSRRGNTWAMIDNSDIRTDLATLLYALNSLGTKFPVFGLSAAKITARLAEQ